ncbi:MAG TPA: ABC transporter permease [Candidatus Methylomirabilis sp.]|nr:ABC transporter permease [Candidatus Methylomirabilis sp.]
MTQYLIRRILALVPVMLVVATLVFVLMHLTPGDPVSAMLGMDANPADVQRMRVALGLDQPLHLQYAQWIGKVLHGNFGESIFLQIPVLAAVAERLEPTLLLTLLAMGVAVGLGIPAGVISATRFGSLADQGFMSLALLGVSMPEFWLGLNLIFFVAVKLGWFPVAGYVPLGTSWLATLRYLAMPAFCLGFVQSALIARMTRAVMLDVLSQDYIRTGHAKGLSQRRVVCRHALKNALIPTLTVIGISFAILMGGTIVIETVFNIPGVGRLLIQSVLRRDYPVIQGVVLLIAGAYVLINLLVDVAYAYLDPRIKYV